MTASDAVAQFNSSGAGGTLPKNLRFGRINYATETVLPTRWWMWKCGALSLSLRLLGTWKADSSFLCLESLCW